MCQFSHLFIGEKVELNANPMYCRDCNAQSSYSGDANYAGHSLLDGMIYDCFIDLDIACPGCGRGFSQYIELCKDINYSMELEEVHNAIQS